MNLYRKDNFYLQLSNATVTSKVNRYQTYMKSSMELVTIATLKKKNLSTCVTTQKVRLVRKTLTTCSFTFFQSFTLGQGHPNNWHETEDLWSYYSVQFESPRKSHTNTHHYTYSLLSRSKSNQNKTESTLKTRRTQGRVGSTNKCFLLAPQLIRRGRKVILGSRTSRWARPKHPQSCCKISKLPLDKVCFERAQKAHKVCLRQIFTQRNSSDEVPLWCQWH